MGTTPTHRPHHGPGNPARAPAPAAPYLAGFLAIYAALSCLAWLAGELAGWLWTRRWPPADGSDALAVLIRLSRDPGHPALAWPPAARHDLAPTPPFYALAVVLLLAIMIPSARLELAWLARGRRWSDPNPRRAGFARSGALTTRRAATGVGTRPPSWPRQPADDDPVAEAAG